MNSRLARQIVTATALVTVACAGMPAQQPTAPAAGEPAAPARNNVRKAIRWKQLNYACDNGAKLIVYLSADLAKVRYGDDVYLMKQTISADGNRYSDGKVVWWGKGTGGFLQEDTPDGNGKMMVQGCQLEKPLATESLTGTVSYLERLALPSNAVILVQLLDVSRADAPSRLVASQSINLGQRQVPVPFALTFDPAKIDAQHSYAVSAKISVDGKLTFITDQSYPVLTKGEPSHADLILKAVSATSSN